MKRIRLLITLLTLAALAVTAGCGGGGGGGAAPVGVTTSTGDGGSPTLETGGAGGETSSSLLPDGTEIAVDTPMADATRQTLRVVGDAGCTASRAFSNTYIVPSGSLFVKFTLSGCTVPLQSLYYAEDIPASGLTVTPVDVKINGGSVAYTYEADTATSTYHHFILDEVPADGLPAGNVLPAGGTLEVTYFIQDDGVTNSEGYEYEFPLFLWAGYTGAANVWGYADAATTITLQPPPPGASGGPDINGFYVNAKAFDGNYNSWWVGTVGTDRWDLYYGFSQSWHMDDIFINFYNANYVPTTINIYYSDDGATWNLGGTMPPGDDKPTLNINVDLKYIWIEMLGTPAVTYPLIRDIDWLPVFESETSTGGLNFGPSNNPDLYYPSNVFDGDLNTWWVGKLSNGTWDIYYNFGTEKILSEFTVYWYSINHQPPTSTLYYSDDGITWNQAGDFIWGPTSAATLARKATYIRVNMNGNPTTNFPLIRDSARGTPIGASGGFPINSSYTPAKAFDADPNTIWAGRVGDGTWSLFYGYAAPHNFTNVKVWFYANPYVPTTTEVFTSNNGEDWTSQGTMPATVSDPLPGFPNAVSTTLNLGGLNANYICYYMEGDPVNNLIVHDISQ